MDFTSQNTEKKNDLKKKLYIFDQDGTLYLDFELHPNVKETLDYIESTGAKIVFLSNNSSISTTTYQKRLSEILDKNISSEQVYVSTLATIQYLKDSNIKKVYAIGTPDFEKELSEAGLELVQDAPKLIVLAFDKTLTYEKLEKACLLILSGTKYIATHPDNVCPTKKGDIPDIGSFIALIEKATGKSPEKILGKPNPDIVNYLLKQFGLEKEDAIIFGDRLYTDIKLGQNAGITTALMLTGETKEGDLEGSDVQPDFVFKEWAEVCELLKD